MGKTSRKKYTPEFKAQVAIEEQCFALGLPRSTYYYRPLVGEPDRNLEIMRRIDHQYTEHPAMGARQMVDYLKEEGFRVGRKLVRRLIRLMDIKAINKFKKKEEAPAEPEAQMRIQGGRKSKNTSQQEWVSI